MNLLALIWGLSFTGLAIWIIGIAAICAIVAVALRVFKITPPAWAVQVFWIVVVAFVCIGAVLIIHSMVSGL